MGSSQRVILTQLAQALRSSASTIRPGSSPWRRVRVSVASFSELARRYGHDLAIIGIDAHPDLGTPASQDRGFQAMAVAALTGHGTGRGRRCGGHRRC
jgi:Arginase family